MVKRKDGLWQEQIKLPGMKKPKYFYGKTQKEVKKKMTQWQKEQESGHLFNAVADAWQVLHEKQVSYNGSVVYNASLNRAKDHFDQREISSIRPDEIDAYILYLAGRGYSKKTISNDRNMLNMIFNYAIINRMLSINPCSAVKLPAGLPKKERDIPSDEQLKKVVEGMGLDFGLFPIMLLYTGLRRGELLALKWSDIDPKNNVIHVTKSVYFVGESPQLKLPKTESGKRDVILLDALKNVISVNGKKGYIFGGESPMRKSEVRRKWIAWCREAGLATKIERTSGKSKNGQERTQVDWKPDITPHQLRHAYATILFDAGVSVKDAQDLLGHSSIQVTMDIYTHIRKKRKEDTAEALNKFVSDGKVVSIKTGNAV